MREQNITSNQYSGKAEYYFESQRREMLTYVPVHVKRLLEIGCGSGSFAKTLKTERHIEVTGIEPEHRAFLQASMELDRVLHLDVDAGIEALSGEYFDCVVFNDVLEHLIDPWAALTKVHTLLRPHGCVVASIPNIRYMPTFKEFVINGNWVYQKDGVMDKTHLRFFTKKSIATLFESSGYKIVKLEGINGCDFPWKYSLLNRIIRGRLEDTKFQQFACVATPKF